MSWEVNLVHSSVLKKRAAAWFIHAIKGGLGMLPQQAVFWIMGPECTACLFHRKVLMNLFGAFK